MTVPTAKIARVTAATLAGALLAGGGYALAAGNSGKTLHACQTSIQTTTGTVRHVLVLQRRCRRGQRGVSWNQRGPAGPQGKTGQAGVTGQTGPVGATGPIGPAGTAGPPATDAFGTITVDPSGAFVTGQNLAVTRTGQGVATVTVTGGHCANNTTPIPVVSPLETGGVAPYPEIASAQPTSTPDQFSINIQQFNGTTWTLVDGASVNVAVYCPS